MGRRIEYQTGDIVGNFGVRFKEEIPSSSTKRKAIFICPYDGVEFEASFSNVKTGHTQSCGCLTKKKLSELRQQNLVGKKFGQLTVLEFSHKDKSGKYIWKCECDCEEHNIVFASTSNLNNGSVKRCKQCKYKLIGDNESLDLTGQKFGELTALYYTGMKDNQGSRIWHCRCSCNNELNVPASQLQHGKYSCGCTRIKSYGEEQVQKILNELNILYIQQYTFKTCYNPQTKYLLPFDFYLPDYNCCIEYDGEQHYTGWHRDIQDLEKIQYRDKIKNEWCQQNHITLLRISYLEKDMMMDKIKRFLQEVN